MTRWGGQLLGMAQADTKATMSQPASTQIARGTANGLGAIAGATGGEPPISPGTALVASAGEQAANATLTGSRGAPSNATLASNGSEDNSSRQLQSGNGGNKQPVVTAEGKVGDSTFSDVNQMARANADPNQQTIISDRVAEKVQATGKDYPNGNMADAHAEIGVIQQAYDAGKTQGQSMSMNVTGKDVCGYCQGDIAAAAEKSGLKSLTVNAIDNITGAPKIYYWVPGMKSIKVKP